MNENFYLLKLLEIELSKTIIPAANTEVAQQIATLSARLVSRAITNQTVVPELHVDAMASIEEYLPALKEHLSADQYQQLQSILTTKKAEDWVCLEALLEQSMASLIRQGNSESIDLARKLIAIDARLREKKEANYRSRANTKHKDEEGFDFGSFDEQQQQSLLTFLKAQFPSEKTLQIANVKVIPGGFSKQTVFIELAGNSVLPSQIVLRRDAPYETSGTSVTMEYPVIERMFQGGVVVPQPFALESTGEILDTPFIVLSRVEGQNIGDFLGANQECPGFNIDLAKQLARLHQVSLHGLEDVLRGGRTSVLERMRDELDEHIQMWDGLAHYQSYTMKAALDWLDQNISLANADPVIIHRDAALHNLLVDGNKVSAFLDWETCCAGAVAEDLGYAYHMVSQLGCWGEFVDAYEQAAGVNLDRKQLDYYIIWGMVRPCVGIARTGEAVKSEGRNNLPTLYIGEHFTETLLERISLKLAEVLSTT